MERTIIVDVETSGLSASRGGRVIEIGAVVVEGGHIIDEYAALIDTGVSISYGAFQVHGISEQMLCGQPSPQDIWPNFAEFVGNMPLVAHNASFDCSFVRNELALVGLLHLNLWHCTLRLARKKLPKLPNHRLDTVYCHLFGGLPAGVQRHRALDDARMAARIWVGLS